MIELLEVELEAGFDQAVADVDIVESGDGTDNGVRRAVRLAPPGRHGVVDAGQGDDTAYGLDVVDHEADGTVHIPDAREAEHGRFRVIGDDLPLADVPEDRRVAEEVVDLDADQLVAEELVVQSQAIDVAVLLVVAQAGDLGAILGEPEDLSGQHDELIRGTRTVAHTVEGCGRVTVLVLEHAELEDELLPGVEVDLLALVVAVDLEGDGVLDPGPGHERGQLVACDDQLISEISG